MAFASPRGLTGKRQGGLGRCAIAEGAEALACVIRLLSKYALHMKREIPR